MLHPVLDDLLAAGEPQVLLERPMGVDVYGSGGGRTQLYGHPVRLLIVKGA